MSKKHSLFLLLVLTSLACAQFGTRSAPVRTTAYTRSLLYPPDDANDIRPLLNLGVFNVKDDPYFAKGDGVTDDKAAFQSAIDDAFAVPGGKVIVPPGTYVFSAGLSYENTSGSVVSGITIEGYGRPTLDFSALTGSAKAISITGQDTSNKIETMLILRNLYILGPDSAANTGSPSTSTIGLEFSWIMDLQLYSVEVDEFCKAIWIDNSWPIRTEGCIFTDSWIGAQFDDNCTIGYHQSQFDENYHNLYLQDSVTNQTFISCLFQNCSGNAVTVDPNTGDKAWGLVFINPYFETVGGNAISFLENFSGVESDGHVMDVVISGGVWDSVTGYAIQGATASAGNVHSVTVQNAYGIDAVADVNGYLCDSMISSGNTSTPNNEMFWYYNYQGDRHVVPLTDDTSPYKTVIGDLGGLTPSAADATLHVYRASAGTVTADGDADTLVLEDNTDMGMTLLSPDNKDSGIFFGTPSDNRGAELLHDYDGNQFIIGTSNAGHSLVLMSDNRTTAVTIGTDQTTHTQNVYPSIDDTYYLGKNDDDTPFAWKGLVLKDTTNGKYYRIEVVNGVVTATDLTD